MQAILVEGQSSTWRILTAPARVAKAMADDQGSAMLVIRRELAILAGCSVVCAAFIASAPIAAAKTDVPAATPAAVIISGGPSIIALPHSGLIMILASPCRFFYVTVLQPKPGMRMTTSGLGPSLLAPVSDSASSCPPPGAANWRSELIVRASQVRQRLRFAIMIDVAAALPGESGDLDGRIVIFDGAGELASEAIKTQWEKGSTLAEAWSWFLGLVAPALVAFGFAWLGPFVERRRAAVATLNTLRVLESDKLEKFFQDLDVVLGDTYERPGQLVYGHLKTHEVLAALPMKAQRRIVEHCATNDMRRLVNALRRLFFKEAKSLKHARPVPVFFVVSQYWTS